MTAKAHSPVRVPEKSPSLDERAEKIIQDALASSEGALAKGHGRQAVAEVLWLLETISTVFKGHHAEGKTIEGEYFNVIVKEMKSRTLSPHQKQILSAMPALHHYLSSPQGGGIRHGQDLQEGIPLSSNDARLYCDLIRSYIAYMIEEHHRLRKAG